MADNEELIREYMIDLKKRCNSWGCGYMLFRSEEHYKKKKELIDTDQYTDQNKEHWKRLYTEIFETFHCYCGHIMPTSEARDHLQSKRHRKNLAKKAKRKLHIYVDDSILVDFIQFTNYQNIEV